LTVLYFRDYNENRTQLFQNGFKKKIQFAVRRAYVEILKSATPTDDHEDLTSVTTIDEAEDEDGFILHCDQAEEAAIAACTYTEHLTIMKTTGLAASFSAVLLHVLLLLLAAAIEQSNAFALVPFSRGNGKRATSIAAAASAVVTTALDNTAQLVSPDTTGIIEEACLDTAARMRRLSVPVSTDIHPTGQVGISYVHWPAAKKNSASIPVFLIHGFDSSCLEYRRLGDKLAKSGIDTYAVDLLGWGFTLLDGVKSFSAQSKVEALNSFIDTILQSTAAGKRKNSSNKFCIAGASLGGAAAIEVAVLNPACAGLVLLDAQGFVDGVGPMAALPTPLAKLGVGVLSTFLL
jgi:Serine aminopeptidase, S33